MLPGKAKMSTNEKKEARAPSESRSSVSQAVIKRLPRYFRYLRELIRQGKTRISSAELSQIMNITASQIRQDLNCFGGFGQQGYGYNVNYLYSRISDILGVSAALRAIIVGMGDMGRALARNQLFEKRGVEIVGLYDIDPNLIGKRIRGIPIRNISELEETYRNAPADLAVLTVPKDAADAMADRLNALGIEGIWNFTGRELSSAHTGAVVENVHLGDSLMTLNYRLCTRRTAPTELFAPSVPPTEAETDLPIPGLPPCGDQPFPTKEAEHKTAEDI